MIAHPSADDDVLRTALIRGAFDYAGQKCSAASRAYLPRSVWNRMGDDLITAVDELPMGDPRDLDNFLGAVIDEGGSCTYEQLRLRARKAGKRSG